MARETAGALLERAFRVAEEETTVVPVTVYSEHLERAAYRIPRDPDDVPTVALALALGGNEGRCGIWTNEETSSVAASRRGLRRPCYRT
jgi:predicted nucleic acid-binding protein